MAIDMSELNGDPDFSETVTLRRPLTPTFANEGVATYGYAADAPLVATVQPAKPSDLAMLPEGVNLSETISVWSGTQMKVGDETGQGSDIIVWGGKSYRVIKLEDRSKNGYWRAFAEGFAP